MEWEARTQTSSYTLKDAGPALRKDDPGSLKEIVVKVLERAKQREQGESSDPHFSTARMRFMVEAITDLKNNKTKPPPTAELIPQLKRAQRTTVGKRGIPLSTSIPILPFDLSIY